MPDLFLSYSRHDSATMEIMRDDLTALGFNIWVDVDGLPIGTREWQRAIEEAINTADGMIVILSPTAKQSEWVNKEIYMAQMVYQKPIFPVLIEGDQRASVPPGLMGTQYADMRRETESDDGFNELVESLSRYFDADIGEHPIELLPGDPADALSGEREKDNRTILISVSVLLIAIIGIIGIGSQLPFGGASPTEEAPPETATTFTWTDVPPPTETIEVQPTATITSLPAEIDAALVLAEAGVSSNDDWAVYTSRFENDVEMALVPAGCFEMGTSSASDFVLVHTVCFDSPFWIDVYEVTNDQVGRVNTLCESSSSEPNQPHICINWNNAKEHCESREARLPTEAEWEYATRGPDSLWYPWGTSFVEENTVYVDNSTGQPSVVGSRPGGVSWVGAYDLIGNVREWVADWYGTYPSEQQTNPLGPDNGSERVLRGGAWDNSSKFLWASSRYSEQPESGNLTFGFRCARDYTP